MKQTALEWLIEQYENGIMFRCDELKIQEQAKAMEKEQMIDAYVTGQYDLADKKFRPQEYYNETYGGMGSDTNDSYLNHIKVGK